MSGTLGSFFFFCKVLASVMFSHKRSTAERWQLSTWVVVPVQYVQIPFLVPLSSEGPFAKCMLWVTMSCCRFNVLYIETRLGNGGRVKVGKILLISHKQNCYARISKDCTDLCAGSLVKLWGSGYFRKKLSCWRKKNSRTESQRWRTLN